MKILSPLFNRSARSFFTPPEHPRGFGVRWVRGEDAHRFGNGGSQTSESGVSPVPRQPPHSKTLARIQHAASLSVTIL